MATYGKHEQMSWWWHVKKWLGFKVRPQVVHPFDEQCTLLGIVKRNPQILQRSIELAELYNNRPSFLVDDLPVQR